MRKLPFLVLLVVGIFFGTAAALECRRNEALKMQECDIYYVNEVSPIIKRIDSDYSITKFCLSFSSLAVFSGP